LNNVSKAFNDNGAPRRTGVHPTNLRKFLRIRRSISKSTKCFNRFGGRAAKRLCGGFCLLQVLFEQRKLTRTFEQPTATAGRFNHDRCLICGKREAVIFNRLEKNPLLGETEKLCAICLLRRYKVAISKPTAARDNPHLNRRIGG